MGNKLQLEKIEVRKVSVDGELKAIVYQDFKKKSSIFYLVKEASLDDIQDLFNRIDGPSYVAEKIDIESAEPARKPIKISNED